MPAPTLVFSEQNGASTGTPTDGLTVINFASIDEPSNTSGLLVNYPIVAGTNSFEKYWRMKVTGVASNTLSSFGVYFSATAPVDGAMSSATLTMYFGVTATYTPPVATTSTVATTLCSTVTSGPGTTFVAPANTLNAYSGYFVQQLDVMSSATGGNVTYPSVWGQATYVYS